MYNLKLIHNVFLYGKNGMFRTFFQSVEAFLTLQDINVLIRTVQIEECRKQHVSGILKATLTANRDNLPLSEVLQLVKQCKTVVYSLDQVIICRLTLIQIAGWGFSEKHEVARTSRVQILSDQRCRHNDQFWTYEKLYAELTCCLDLACCWVRPNCLLSTLKAGYH